MTMTAEDFLAALAEDVPEVQPVVVEHLEDNFDERLLNLLTADLRRFAIDAFVSDQSDVLRRLLVVIDRALANGDEHVNNAMAVSFVEDTGWWDPAMASFIATWPPAMQTEARRQQGSQSS